MGHDVIVSVYVNTFQIYIYKLPCQQGTLLVVYHKHTHSGRCPIDDLQDMGLVGVYECIYTHSYTVLVSKVEDLYIH